MLWKLFCNFPEAFLSLMSTIHRTRIYLCVCPALSLIHCQITFIERVLNLQHTFRQISTALLRPNFARSENAAARQSRYISLCIADPTLSSIRPFIGSIEILRWLSCSCNDIALVSKLQFWPHFRQIYLKYVSRGIFLLALIELQCTMCNAHTSVHAASAAKIHSFIDISIPIGLSGIIINPIFGPKPGFHINSKTNQISVIMRQELVTGLFSFGQRWR